ncbi:MAG: hypothetical protein ACJAZC_000243 [Cryomorphaceae bacterium]|jgi:hypothetical protein
MTKFKCKAVESDLLSFGGVIFHTFLLIKHLCVRQTALVISLLSAIDFAHRKNHTIFQLTL